MFKMLFKFVTLLFLLLGNMALFTWCANYLAAGNSELEKTLINNVRADAPRASNSTAYQGIVLQMLPQPTTTTHHLLSPNTAPKEDNQQRIILHFSVGQTQLDAKEQARLESLLSKLQLEQNQAVQVSAGPVSSHEQSVSPQIAKLRVHQVIRTIYPYTQNVKMFYRSTIDTNDSVVVEFIQPIGKSTKINK